MSPKEEYSLSVKGLDAIRRIQEDYCKKQKQELLEEFITFLERNEMEIIKDIDTIGFIIKGLKKEGFQYILDDKKEWVVRRKE